MDEETTPTFMGHHHGHELHTHMPINLLVYHFGPGENWTQMVLMAASALIWLSFTQKAAMLLRRWDSRFLESAKLSKNSRKMEYFADTWQPLSQIAPFSLKSLHLLGRNSGIWADRPYRELPGAYHNPALHHYRSPSHSCPERTHSHFSPDDLPNLISILPSYFPTHVAWKISKWHFCLGRIRVPSAGSRQMHYRV